MARRGRAGMSNSKPTRCNSGSLTCALMAVAVAPVVWCEPDIPTQQHRRSEWAICSDTSLLRHGRVSFVALQQGTSIAPGGCRRPQHSLLSSQDGRTRKEIPMPSQNDNGGHGGPWGRGVKPGPDFEDMVRQGQDRLKQVLPAGGPRSTIALAILAVVGLAVWTAYYTVPSDSVAVVQRFGRYLKDVPAGLHFKLPLGIDVATIVPVKRQLKQEFGFATPGATDPFQTSRDGKRETQMVTGDLNAVLVEWVVQYRILDPVKFLFDVREPRGTLRDVSESVMREVVGDRTVDEVITIGRQEIETEALTKMQALATKYAMGISIDQVQLKKHQS